MISQRELHRIRFKPLYDTTESQLLIYPAYNLLYAQDPLTRFYPDVDPTHYTSKGCDFMIQDFSMIDLANNLKFTRQQLAPLSHINKVRVENVIIRKFNQAKFNLLKYEIEQPFFEWCQGLPSYVCARAYYPTGQNRENIKLCKSKDPLEIGHEWFQLLKEYRNTRSKSTLSSLEKAFYEPKNHIPISRKSKRKMLGIKPACPDKNSKLLTISRTFHLPVNRIDFVDTKEANYDLDSQNVRFNEQGYLQHSYASNVKFDWKVQKRTYNSIESTDCFLKESQVLLRIDKCGQRNVYLIPNFCKVPKEELEPIVKIMHEYLPLFIQAKSITISPSESRCTPIYNNLYNGEKIEKYNSLELTDYELMNHNFNQDSLMDMVAFQNKTLIDSSYQGIKMIADFLHLGAWI